MPLTFEISVEPGKVIWRVGKERLPVEKVLEESDDSSRGSITFFNNGKNSGAPVYYSRISIIGDLDPLWIEDEISRQSVEALRAIDPEYPFLTSRLSLEETVRGSRDRGSAPRVLFSDGFHKALRSEWKIRREHASHWSLTTKTGALTITTERGALVGSSRSYKNLFLIGNPADRGDFEIRTRLVGFEPSQEVQQAGLICIDDDDNYVKATIEFARGQRRFVLLREVGGKVVYLQRSMDPQWRTVWLRLRKRGDLYSLATSRDGRVFDWQGELRWPDDAPKYLGLLAKNSLPLASEIDASFDLFEVRSLAPAEGAR